MALRKGYKKIIRSHVAKELQRKFRSLLGSIGIQEKIYLFSDQSFLKLIEWKQIYMIVDNGKDH